MTLLIHDRNLGGHLQPSRDYTRRPTKSGDQPFSKGLVQEADVHLSVARTQRGVPSRDRAESGLATPHGDSSPGTDSEDPVLSTTWWPAKLSRSSLIALQRTSQRSSWRRVLPLKQLKSA